MEFSGPLLLGRGWGTEERDTRKSGKQRDIFALGLTLAKVTPSQHEHTGHSSSCVPTYNPSFAHVSPTLLTSHAARGQTPHSIHIKP